MPPKAGKLILVRRATNQQKKEPEEVGDIEKAHNSERKRYNCCKQCGSNCVKSRDFCYRCKRKRERLEKAMKKIDT